MISNGNPLAWQDDALCAQTAPEAFHPEKGESNTLAKSICARCEVTAQCLEYALDNRIPDSVWGGLSAHERKIIYRKRVA